MRVTKDELRDIIGPIIERFRAYVDAKVATIPAAKDGEPGPAGPQGPAGAPGQQGDRGEQGDPGAGGAPGADGKDGRDGRDGKDGAPGRDALEIDILPAIAEGKSYPRGTFAQHGGGIVRAYRDTGPLAGDLATAGWAVVVNGIAGEAEDISEDGRTITRRTFYTDDRVMERTFKTAAMLYRGVWREGEHEAGDVATWSGSAWHCNRATTDKPGTSDAWRLMVKSGRDGRDAPQPPAESKTVRLK